MVYFLFPRPRHKRKRVEVSRGILASNAVWTPNVDLEGEDPFISPIVYNKLDSASRCHCHCDHIRGQGGV